MKMMGKLRLCTVSLFWLIAVVNSICDPRDTGCRTNNNDYANDTDVYPTAVLNCNFAGSLCCYRQGCVDDEMERWKANLGYASVRQNSTGCGSSVYSILESPLVDFSTPSCVEFTYDKVILPYQLHVFLAFNNGTLPSSKYNSTEANTYENRTSRFDVKCLTGKIQFRAKGGGANAEITLPKLYHVRIIDGSCANLDQATSAPTSTSEQASSENSDEVSDPTTCDLVTTPPGTENTTTSSPQYSVTGGTTSEMSTAESSAGGGNGNNVAVIVGALVAAVAFVVLFVIIFIAYRRKFKKRKPDGRKSSVKRLSTSARDGDYTDIDAVGTLTQATAGNADFNPDDPYELALDGAPGKTRSSHTDPFTNGASHYNQHQLNGTLEDDYSCIDDTQPTATGAHGKNTAPAQPDPRDVYSVVNKPGKKTPTPGYSLENIVGDKPVLSNPNDEYSVVNKKGKKPDLAPKPGHSDTEYNTISHKGNTATGDKAARGATSDPYNRIDAVASLGTDGQNRESTTAEEGSLVDDYNTLDFADTHQNEPKKEKIGGARAAYDHVHNDPDDTYNKTRIGKRNVVIGSDYDHVKPSN
ncbi:uncharacterized protein [Littorina saxatilis]|uniref:uncharacterized protein n=1 Tax=Littorina saxatilis TaxID=31220 RepID=UPI0038B4F75F